MPAPRGKLTDVPEIAAYMLALAAGFAWGFTVNPIIFRSLVAQGYQDHLTLVVAALGIAVSVVVLLIFLLLRKAIAGSGAPPPPANVPPPPVKSTDLPELGAYVLAHGASIAWNAIVTPLIFRALLEQGHRALLQGVGISLSITGSNDGSLQLRKASAIDHPFLELCDEMCAMVTPLWPPAVPAPFA
jgi:hypothetical protein